MKAVKVLLISILIMVVCGNHIFADHPSKQQNDVEVIEPEIYSENFRLSNEEFIAHSTNFNELNAGGITTMSSPSGIQLYRIYAVGSSYTSPNWEFISPGQTETDFDHGGSEIIVAVLQYGYGNFTSATLNASSGTVWATDYICGTISNMYFCSPGETIRGYLKYHRFTNKQGGFFSSSAYSNLVPYGSWTTSIYIK